jgi:hypothetical protein
VARVIDAAATADLAALLGAMLAEQRRQTALLEQVLANRGQPVQPALAQALADYFGPAPFTAAGVLDAASDDGPLADAVGAVIDLNLPQHARLTALGAYLARQPWLRADGDRRGARLYRLRA